MPDSDIITGQYVQISQTPASVGERMVAQLIDWFVELAYGFFCAYVIDLVYITFLAGRQGASSLHTLVWVAVVLLPILFYGPLCEMLNHGQTVGKKLMKLRVVRKDGAMPTLGNSLLRWLLFLVDGPLLSFVGVVVMLVTPHRQRLGDLAAGTLVIKLGSYSRIAVSLDEFSHLARDYRPTYPQAADLTLEQANLISKTLRLEDDDDPRVHALARKVQQVLGIGHIVESNDHTFLWRLEKDYQYFALEEI